MLMNLKIRGKETKETIAPARLVQAQAENLPFEDNEFDAVARVYLFHELPREVRGQLASEMARVVRPGGTVVFTDSCQEGGRPIHDPYLQNFEWMNEPTIQKTVYGNILTTQDFVAILSQSALRQRL